MLWGRNIELELLKRILGERMPSSVASRLYVLEGPSGIGKTAVIKELLGYLKTLPKPMIILEPVGWDKLPDTNAESLFMGALGVVGFERPEVYEGEGWQSYWQRLLNESIPEMPAVVVVVDGYEKLSPHKKIFLKEMIFDPLKAYALSHDSRFVLSCAQPMPEGELETFWPGLLPQNIPLAPLQANSLKEWLHAAKEPTEALPEMEAKTQGVPAKVEEYLREKREQRLEQLAVKAEQELLKNVEAKNRKTLCVAALIETVSEGMLEYFVGSGNEALQWLAAQTHASGGMTDEGYHMHEEPRELIKAWYSRRDPLGYSDTLARLQGLKTMSSNFGGSKERRILGQLALLKNFTSKLIEQLYGEDADDVLRYMRMHADMFKQTGLLWELHENYKQAGKMATEMIMPADKEKFVARVAELWQRRREEILKQMEDAERGIVEDKEALNKTVRDLEKLEPGLASINTQLSSLKQTLMPQEKSVSSIQEGWNAAGVMFVLLGVVWIYAGVLTAQGVTLSQCAAGAFLILVGLSAPQMGRTHATVVAAAPAQPLLPPEVLAVEKNKHYMQMRYTALDHKKRSLTAKISSKKTLVTELEGYLDKPYL